MDIGMITDFFTQYGAVAIFIIVLLEYLNLPGFPAGVVFPVAGVMAAQGKIHFGMVMVITCAAGIAGSLILYALGRLGGSRFLEAYMKRFPKQRQTIEKHIAWIRQKGYAGVFLAKLLPMVRTLESIPAGVLKLDLQKYALSAACGIFVWNLVFVGAGYLLGDQVFELI